MRAVPIGKRKCADRGERLITDRKQKIPGTFEIQGFPGFQSSLQPKIFSENSSLMVVNTPLKCTFIYERIISSQCDGPENEPDETGLMQKHNGRTMNTMKRNHDIENDDPFSPDKRTDQIPDPKLITDPAQLPIALNATQVAAVLGISRAGAYNLMHSEGFPTLFIGKRMVVPKDRLLAWMNAQVSS